MKIKILAILFLLCLELGYAEENIETDYISGTFIQLNDSNSQKSRGEWSRVLEDMNEIGIDTVIIQYSAYNQVSFFNTESSQYRLSTDNKNPIESILEKADELEMNVFIGLNLDERFNVTYNANQNIFEFNYNLENIIRESKSMLLNLYSRYKLDRRHDSFIGWYLPIEFNDANVIRSGHKKFRDDVVEYYATLSKFAHDNTDLETMISPYFASSGSFTSHERRDIYKYAQWWNDILDDNRGDPNDQFLDIDIIAHQDSVGVGDISSEEAERFFKILKPIFQENEVQFWSNNEAFKVTSNGFVPTSFIEFKKQIHATSKYVQKSIFFEFSTYMKNENNPLYDDYKEYYEAW